ncbi:hypothetical protein P7C70_g6071, partial [Phenoliferia sp. Uapishka_3]
MLQAQQTPISEQLSFSWTTQNDSLREIPQCSTMQFTPQLDTTATASPTPPFSLMVLPQGELRVLNKLSSAINTTGNWTANYSVGTKLMFAMRDKHYYSGGAVAGFYVGDYSGASSQIQFITSGLGLSSCSSPATTLAATGTATSSPPSSTFSSLNGTKSQRSSDAGPIAGGVVGGLGLLAIIAVAILWYRRSRNKKDAALLANTSAVSLPENDGHFKDDGGVAFTGPGGEHYAQYPPPPGHTPDNSTQWSGTHLAYSPPPPIAQQYNNYTPELYEASESPAPPSFTSQPYQSSDRFGSPANTMRGSEWEHDSQNHLVSPGTPVGRLPTPGVSITPAPVWQPGGYAAYQREE